MRGRIMREENGKFYILTQKGDFVSAQTVEGFKCGDEIEVKNELIPSHLIKPIVSIAAAVVIVFGGLYGYNIPVRYVDVCINPEIQLSLNAFDRVIEVQGKNDDGVKLARKSKVKNESVDDAIDDIVESAREMGYMDKGDEGERDVIVSVFGNGAAKLSSKIPVDNVRVVEKEDFEKAKKADIPVGKYVLMNELSKADSTQNMDRVKNMSVKQIIDKINDARNTPKPSPTPAVTPIPTSTPEPTPQVTQAPEKTQEPVATATRKPTAKTSSTSSKATISTSKKTTVKTTAKVTALAKATPKPSTTSVPITNSSQKPAVTALPSFDKVTRPSANTTVNGGYKGEQNEETGDNSNNNSSVSDNANTQQDRQPQSDRVENKNPQSPQINEKQPGGNPVSQTDQPPVAAQPSNSQSAPHINEAQPKSEAAGN